MKNNYWILILAFFILWSTARSRDGITDTVYHSILGQVNALYGTGTFRSISGINIDTMTSRGCPTDEHIVFEDPYGTLSGCIVFAASPARVYGQSSPKGLVGIYKNGNIIWHSDTLVDCSTLNGGGIIRTMDLLNDGKVDIVSSWDEGNGNIVDYLWIFSWDGSTGTLISDTSALGVSSLVSYSDYVNVLDTDGDGVWEIEGRWPDQDSIIVVRWDGHKYVNSPDKTIPLYPPRNRASGTIRSRVSTADNKFHYQYFVHIFPTSVQSMNRLYVSYDGDFTLTDVTGRIGWNFGYYKGNLIGWLNPSTCLMKRGDADSSFSYNSPCPPRIVNSYVQGRNFRIDLLPFDSSAYLHDITTNSLVMPVLSPHLWRIPFDDLDILDSTKSYATQSRALGWIRDQPTANKYSTFFDSTKAQLQRVDSASALATLETVLQQSVQDSGSSLLTSEAFALIYFNAQYLAGQLPAQQQNSFTITSSAGQNGSVVPLGDNTVNVGDSISFTIAPAIGYRISGVFIDNADTSVGAVSSYKFSNVAANHLISAFFGINQYIITATADSNGQINPHGDNVVNYGDSITFRINPSAGYHVASVYVDSLTLIGAVPSYTFRNVTANHTIDAFFAINQYTLSTYSMNGTVSKSPSKAMYDSNSVVTLSATPNMGYHFVGWSGDASGSTNPLNVTMNANKNDTAIFAETSFIIIASSGGNGTISPPGDNSVNYGDSIAFSITPAPCYHVSGVYKDDTISLGAPSSYTFDSVKASHTIDAFFAINQYTITASNGPNGSISPHGDRTVNCGDSVTFTIIPASGYHIDGVFVDNADTSVGAVSNYTFRNVTSNHLISAFFAIDQYRLTLNSLPQSGGTTHPNGQAMYDSNTVVSDTAVPNANYRFGHWSGDISISDSFANPINVTMNRAKNITANFVATIQVTVGTDPLGLADSVDGIGYNSTQQFTWDSGSSHVIVTKGPQSGGTGKQFVWMNWTDGGAISHSITPTTGRTYIANFKTQFQLTSSSSPDTTRGITTAEGTHWYDSSYVVADTAKPKECDHLVNWSGDAGGSVPVLVVTMNSVKNITANFAINLDTVTASAGSNGTISPSGNVVLNCSSSQHFTITPNSCSHVDSLIVDGVKTDSTTGYTFTNITGNHTIRSVYAINVETITASAGPNGSISPSGNVQVNCGSNQHFTISPNSCYHVDSLIVDGAKTDSTTSYTFMNATGNHTIRVVFAINVETIIGSAGAYGSIDPQGGIQVNCGSNQHFTVTPNSCYHVDSLIIDGLKTDSTTSYTFNNVTANHSIRAAFRINQDTITASAGSGGSISPTGTVVVNCGSNQTFTIVANTCYHIDSVLVDGTNQGAVSSYSFTNVTTNHIIRAAFRINPDTITASAGSGGSISPTGTVVVNCGSNQTFTVTPYTCYHIDSVIVDGGNQGPISSYTFTNVTAFHSIRAAFKINKDTIAASAAGGGSINPTGNVVVNCGSNQTFTISANTCYHIDSLIVDGTNQGAVSSYTFTNVTANHSIRAAFRINQDTIVASASGGGGSIDPTGNVVVNCGSNQTFTITVANWYHIDSVIVDGTNQGAISSYTFTNVTANHSIRAVLKVNQDTIAASAGAGGSISPSGNVVVNSGSNQTFTISANNCYHIDSVIVDGSNEGAISSYTFTQVSANHSIRAAFKINKDTIAASAGSGGSISPSGNVIVNCSSNQTFTITANSCYHSDSVIVDGTNQGPISSYTFTSVTAHHSIRAVFRNHYIITASASPSGGGSISPSGNVAVNCNANQTFTITTNSGFSLINVTVDGVSQGVISSYTFTNVTADHTISATFQMINGCQPPCCIDRPSGLDQLTLTDALGKQKTLLVRNANRQYMPGVNDATVVSQLSVGTLNAGFQSGQLVQILSPDQATANIAIWVQGATYPLTLRLTTNAENNIQYWLVRSGQSNLQLTNSSSVQIGSSTNGIINIQPLTKQPCQ